MKTLTVERSIAAAPEDVFLLATDLPGAPGRIRNVLAIELLTDGPVQRGTRYRERRLLLGRENTEVMEVLEFEPPRAFELGVDAMGVRFRTRFSFEPNAAGTLALLHFEARPLTLPARIMLGAMGGQLSTLEEECARDLDDLKAAAEAVRR